jgi:hypothetical protein
MTNLPTVELTDAEFDALPEYSCSLPTGPRIGFRFKRGEPYGNPTCWYLAEVAPDPYGDPRYVSFRWSRIAVSMPLLWEGD